MGLKITTTALLIFGFALLLGYPWVLKDHPPKAAPRSVRKAFAVRLLTYNSLVIGSLVGAGFGSVLIVRRVRKEFREEAMLNVRELIESASGDHKKEPHIDA